MNAVTESEPAVPARVARFSGARRTIAAVATAIAVGAVGAYAYHAGGRESTDDAQIERHITPVGARIGGVVLDVLVKENQEVKVGDVLVRIDPRDLRRRAEPGARRVRRRGGRVRCGAERRADRRDDELERCSARGRIDRRGSSRSECVRPRHRGGPGATAGRGSARRRSQSDGRTGPQGSRSAGAARREGRDRATAVRYRGRRRGRRRSQRRVG